MEADDVHVYVYVLVCVAHYDIVWSAAFHTSSADIFASCSQVSVIVIFSVICTQLRLVEDGYC